MPRWREIISGTDRRWTATLQRGLLRAASWPYSAVIATRNLYYDVFDPITWMEVPCISVGNITAGGTGKTPLVIWLLELLAAEGRKAAMISRGYKGRDGQNDELQLVSSRCPQAICLAHPDRIRAARWVIREQQVQAIVLDDAFQHRRIGRNLNIVTIDATCPFGYGHLLPRGLLREPVSSLERADLVVMTRTTQLAAAELAELKTKLEHLTLGGMVLACTHRPTGWIDLADHQHPLEVMLNRTALAFAGIGNPTAFEISLQDCGVSMRRFIPFPDHYDYHPRDLQHLVEQARRAEVEVLLTTEKDLVKLRQVAFEWPLPLLALQIKIDFLAEGAKMLQNRVVELFAPET
ncbi:MAG: Tetraacyldisaccharide 4'-kinase [Phycisphaerae bacterium]|nr:Tetraacyldisaccharide 4'-kinase [Phycisphaerae bacterium]